MPTFTTPNHSDLTDMVAQWRADAAVELLFGAGLFSVLLWGSLVLAIGNVWRGRARRDEMRFIEFVGDLLHSLIR